MLWEHMQPCGGYTGYVGLLNRQAWTWSSWERCPLSRPQGSVPLADSSPLPVTGPQERLGGSPGEGIALDSGVLADAMLVCSPAITLNQGEMNSPQRVTSSQQQTRISASSATRELDELMASLSDFKVP